MSAPPGLEERLRAAADAMPEAPVEIERVLMSARRRRLLGAVVLLVIAAGLVVLLSLGGEAAKRALNATVPDVRDLGLQEAVAKVRAANLRPRVVDACPAGVRDCVVIDQDPANGTTVEPRSNVVLKVGKLVRTPNVLRLRRAHAIRELKSAGLENVSFIAPCRARATCRVGQQSPEPSRLVSLDARVRIRLDVQLPTVVGRPPGDARTRLEAAGLVVEEEGRCANGSPCSVVTQRPRPNTLVQHGTRVTITKRTGTPTRISVPSLLGLDPDSATSRITRLRLRSRLRDLCSVDRGCEIVGQTPRRTRASTAALSLRSLPEGLLRRRRSPRLKVRPKLTRLS